MANPVPTWPYPLETVPAWCEMGEAGHATTGGCLAIATGLVAAEGEPFCRRTCLFYVPVVPDLLVEAQED